MLELLQNSRLFTLFLALTQEERFQQQVVPISIPSYKLCCWKNDNLHPLE